ncbi:hypothetical protein [Stenotrophomonas sp. P5_B8]
MPKTKNHLHAFVIANWGLSGTATAGQAGYRSQNPWQALERYMEGLRGNGAHFLASHNATATRIDSGGSVWKIELVNSPTPQGADASQFSEQLLDNLVAQNTKPNPDDYICITYFDGAGSGTWEWTP